MRIRTNECKRCKRPKDTIHFRMKRNYLSYLCKDCEKLVVEKWNKDNKERALKNMEKYNSKLSSKLLKWKNGAKRRNIEWNLSLQYLETLPLICHYTKEPLTLKAEQSNTVSLDRIDSSKGYIEGNVVFCLVEINWMKRDLPLDRFLQLCNQVSKAQKCVNRDSNKS